MKLDIVVATLEWADYEKCIESWIDTSETEWGKLIIVRGKPILEAYQEGFERSTAEVIFYGHDDLLIFENGWDKRVLKEFEDPTVGLVGFGGALGHGDPQMYKKPYELCQLGRRHFLSNMRDAEVHGTRFTGSCDVSVLDGFALFVRRDVLYNAGGWPLVGPVGYIGYDYWISCITRRFGYKIRLVGVACDHLGGKSTGLNPNLKVDFEGAHEYIYKNFRDCLPALVEI